MSLYKRGSKLVLSYLVGHQVVWDNQCMLNDCKVDMSNIINKINVCIYATCKIDAPLGISMKDQATVQTVLNANIITLMTCSEFHQIF